MDYGQTSKEFDELGEDGFDQFEDVVTDEQEFPLDV
jgi:hypothetical protein